MSQNLTKTLILCFIANIFTIQLCLSRSVGQFCDNNYVDAVLWDGVSYRVTRNEWIGTYNQTTRTVEPFVHKSDDYFKNEKGYYYQSVYHISTVPECNQTTVSCQIMNQLVGLTVVAIRRYFPEKQSFDVIHRTYRSEHLIELNIETFIESYLMPKNSFQKYRPSVYSPKDYTFIHISNQYRNSGPLLETIELQPNGVIERSYHELSELKDIVFITSFWWTFDQTVYIIGEHKSGVGNPFIYELDIRNKNVLLKPINKSVLEFFGCNKSRYNRLEDRIKSQISGHDLNQWTVHMVEETAGPSSQSHPSVYENTFENREEKIVPSIASKNQSQQELGSNTDLLSYNDSSVHQTIPAITDSIDQKTERRAVLSPDPRRPTYKENPNYYQRSYQRPEQRVQQNFEQKPDPIPRVVRVITGQVPYQLSDHSNLEPTPQKPEKISNSGYNIDGSEDPIPDHTIQTEDETQIVKSLEQKKNVSKELSNIWKIFPIILMISLLLIAICILLFGFFAVFNLRNLLSRDIKHRKLKPVKGLRTTQRLKYDNGLSDFFIEEYETPRKHRFPSFDENSCQTNDSFSGSTKNLN